MAAKAIFLLASALFVKIISGQCIRGMNGIASTGFEQLALPGNALACGSSLAEGLSLGAGPNNYPGALANYGLSANGFTPSNGGGFIITSTSPFAPSGITVVSQNGIEGALAVNGELPFLGAVVLEGALPSAGAGGISYGCGNGAVGIVSEGIAPAVGSAYGPLAPVVGVAPGRIGLGSSLSSLQASGLGYNGLAGGCGYGRIY